MAFLKKIKFGESPTNIAKTVVNGAPSGVIAVTNTQGYKNDDSEEKDYSYDIDVRVDDATIVKDGDTSKVLKVGTVPAAQVSVAAGGHSASADPADNKTFVGDDVEEVLLELNQKIEQTGNVARTYTLVDDTENVQDLPTTVLKRYRLQETIGTQSPTLVGANIDIPKDSSLKEVYLGASTDTINTETGVITKNTVTDPQSMNFAYQLANGTYSLVKIDVSKFLTESEFADGLQVVNAVVSVKVDSSSEKDSQETPADFLTVGTDGVKISGIKDEINRKIAALDVPDTAVTGEYVSQVSETDGKIAVVRAAVSAAALNNYTKGSDAAAVAAGDTINQAISKLENQVDAAKAAATTKVAKDANASHLTVTPSAPAADGSITYTIGESDIASKTDLDAEITARKAEETRAQNAETAIDGAVGLTKAASGEGRTYSNTGEYIGKQATNTVTSDIKALDTQLQTVSTNLANIKYNVDGTTLILSGIAKDTSLTA